MPDINKKFVIYYAVRGYRTGQTVSIDVYDTVASKEVDSRTMTEMGATGIYYYNFFPRKRTSYLAVMNCTAYPLQSHQIIRVEKTKLAGAVSIPKIAFPTRTWEINEKELLIKTIKGISKEQLKNKNSAIYFHEKNILGISELIKAIQQSKINMDSLHKSSAELMDSNLIDISKNNTTTILQGFHGLTENFMKEVNNLSKSNIAQNIRELSQKVTELSTMTDETNTNLRLSNDLFSGGIKEKINRLTSQTDELNILLKIPEKIDPTEKESKEGPQSPIMDLPKEKKPYRFVIQEHIRGKSSHLDIRFEVNSHLIGFTMDDPGRVGNPLRFKNDAEYSSAHKVLCQLKSRQPKEWLKTKGEIEPGKVGATKELPAKFKILDSGTYEMGAQKPYIIEVFLSGKIYKGRFIFRKLPTKEEWKDKAGKQPFVWFAWKPIDQAPYVLSQRSLKQEWVPTKGRSALNSEWENKIPKELKWWEKNWEGAKAIASIKEIRKILLKRNILNLERFSFTLQKIWWKGQKVIRDVPVEQWWLKFSNGIYFVLDANPQTQKKGINAIKKTFTDINKSMEFEGDIPPNNPGNPNKKIPAHVEILEKGKLTIIESTEKFINFRFSGTKLSGFWIAKSTDGAFVFETAQATATPKKLSSIKLSEWQLGSIVNLSLTNSLPSEIASVVGCSKETIAYWQRKLKLR